MNKKFNKIYLYLFSIAFIYFAMFAAFYIVCFIDKNSLYKLILKNETYKNLPFSLSDYDLMKICSELMRYISGKIAFLETKVTINNNLAEFYSVRSKIHMADVRNLILNFRNASFISIIVCIYSVNKLKKIESPIKCTKKVYVKTLLATFIILSIITIFAINNFDLFFTKFHELLFTNDLWLLDPNYDYIICLLPEKIFMIYGLRIVVGMVITLFLPYFFLQILSKIQLHQEAK